MTWISRRAQFGTQAGMGPTRAVAGLLVGVRSMDVELGPVREHVLVPVGGRVSHHHVVAGGGLVTAKNSGLRGSPGQWITWLDERTISSPAPRSCGSRGTARPVTRACARSAAPSERCAPTRRPTTSPSRAGPSAHGSTGLCSHRAGATRCSPRPRADAPPPQPTRPAPSRRSRHSARRAGTPDQPTARSTHPRRAAECWAASTTRVTAYPSAKVGLAVSRPWATATRARDTPMVKASR